ncbi:MAG: hypothetical protein GY856_31685 [bacterium]|nr:hypothetical protein [bacterium]
MPRVRREPPAERGDAGEPLFLNAGLDAGTTYTLSVVLTDPAGNAFTVSGLELTTPPAPDTQAPTISALAVGPVTDTTVRITWQTDEPADATVHFGPGLASQVGVLGLATEHAILVTGLDPATTYAFEAVSRDASGNVGAVAGSWTTTSPAPRITSVPEPSSGPPLPSLLWRPPPRWDRGRSPSPPAVRP